ncbi:MAG: hypothetical protein EKK61_04160 [Rickettsiales bacterium]|nr:MAG: hypothetical protein EKK61_04160 [Rickettsiales bacterium]
MARFLRCPFEFIPQQDWDCLTKRQQVLIVMMFSGATSQEIMDVTLFSTKQVLWNEKKKVKQFISRYAIQDDVRKYFTQYYEDMEKLHNSFLIVTKYKIRKKYKIGEGTP